MDIPYMIDIPLPDAIPTRYDNHIIRRLSSMKGQYRDEKAYESLISQSDIVLYEVYELTRPYVSGDLLHGISIIHPGKVGDEFYMTKGHFHKVIDTAEVYYFIKGQGMMVMETPEGDWAVDKLSPGKMLFVPPRWAHRSVNTSNHEDLVMLFIYPAHSGHDYGTIEKLGFRKLVVEINGEPSIIDNPRWHKTG